MAPRHILKSGRSDFLVQRASPAVVLGAAGLLLWFAFAVVTPYMYRHQPGPLNATFGWYVLYKSFPLLLFAAVFLLVFVAFRLLKRWSRPEIPLIAAAATTVAMFFGAILIVLSRS